MEHAGDELTHAVLTKLNQSFITPLDREDIHQLASKLDDVLDFIYACYPNRDVPDYKSTGGRGRNGQDCPDAKLGIAEGRLFITKERKHPESLRRDQSSRKRSRLGVSTLHRNAIRKRKRSDQSHQDQRIARVP
jgi:Protein of unknown function DUF47